MKRKGFFAVLVISALVAAGQPTNATTGVPLPVTLQGSPADFVVANDAVGAFPGDGLAIKDALGSKDDPFEACARSQIKFASVVDKDGVAQVNDPGDTTELKAKGNVKKIRWGRTIEAVDHDGDVATPTIVAIQYKITNASTKKTQVQFDSGCELSAGSDTETNGTASGDTTFSNNEAHATFSDSDSLTDAFIILALGTAHAYSTSASNGNIIRSWEFFLGAGKSKVFWIFIVVAATLGQAQVMAPIFNNAQSLKDAGVVDDNAPVAYNYKP